MDSIDAAHWPDISRLFDEALDVPVGERNTWIARLVEEQPELGPAVRNLLAAHARRETEDFLERGPLLRSPSQDSVDGDSLPGHLKPGDDIGPYRLERPLGRGGMAVVWLARRNDGTLSRDVALKLPQRFVWRPGLAERFSRERDILARLEHPHIARLYDAGLSSESGPGAGLPYLALEFVQGFSLTAYCDEHRLSLARRIDLAMQVLEAVQYAHARLVIHRDLKPANILVTDEGQVRLLDFGVAKLLVADDSAADHDALTQLAGQAYTPDYASPEQVRGEALGTASDVYSMGVVLYELLAGERPYLLRHASAAQLEQAIVDVEPEPPSCRADVDAAAKRSTTLRKLRRELHGELDTIVLKALKKEPSQRYGSMAELADDLRRHRDGLPLLAKPDSFSYRAKKYVQRNKIQVASAAAIVIALGAGLVVALWQYREALEQARIARDEASTAESVQGFMQDIFLANSTDQADPLKARQTTAEELLDIAGRKLKGAMTETPNARMRMLGVLTGIYEGLGLHEKAVATARLSLDTAEKAAVSGEVMLDILEQYEGALEGARRHDEKEVVLKRRVELARSMKLGDSLALARIERSIAYSAMLLESPEALPHFTRAIELFRRFHDDAGLLDALFLQADLYNYGPTFDPVAARAAALEALDLLKRIRAAPSGSPMRNDELSLYKELSESASLLDDPKEALRYGRLAITSALAMHQKDDLWARFVSFNLSRQLIFAARPLEAIAFLEDSWHLADPATGNVAGAYQLKVLMAYSRAQVAAGRVEQALATGERATRLSLKVGVEPEWPADWAWSSAAALLQLGQIGAAQEALDKSAAITTGAHHSVDKLLPLRAELDLARGDAAGARAALLAWQRSPRVAKTLRSRLEVDCLIAEAALLEGKSGEADRLSGEVLRKLEAYDQRASLADVEACALRVRGLSLLERQDAASALPVLRRAVTLLEGVLDTQASLPFASLLGTLAEAQARTGDREQARRTLDRMKQIHAGHRDVGPSIRQELARVSAELEALRRDPRRAVAVRS